MKQCLKITFLLPDDDNFLQKIIQRYARRLELEGVAQMVEPKRVQVVACGSKEAIEKLIDTIYQGDSKAHPENVEVEPFTKEQNFRGIFRVIE